MGRRTIEMLLASACQVTMITRGRTANPHPPQVAHLHVQIRSLCTCLYSFPRLCPSLHLCMHLSVCLRRRGCAD